MTSPRFLLDASLSLINRTGAHFIADELSRELPRHHDVVIRRWRTLNRALPPSLPRKVLGRLMLKELVYFADARLLPWPEPDAATLCRIFLDPLYVLRSRLTASDIVLCHDVGPITHPNLYDPGTIRMYRAAYAKLCAAQPGMVFVSDASRRAFETLYGKAFRFARVIWPMVRDSSDGGTLEPIPGLEAPFLLTVGALERRKNQQTAIRAFAESGLHQAGFRYVLCGARGAGADEITAAAAATPGVQVLGYVSDAQLRWLYRTATAFVLPSLLEGFGMPALEAARHGLLPILSRDSALSEAAGGLGISVDPYSTTEIARAMREAAALSAAARAELGQKLIAHASGATRASFVDAWTALLAREASEPELHVAPVALRSQ